MGYRLGGVPASALPVLLATTAALSTLPSPADGNSCATCGAAAAFLQTRGWLAAPAPEQIALEIILGMQMVQGFTRKCVYTLHTDPSKSGRKKIRKKYLRGCPEAVATPPVSAGSWRYPRRRLIPARAWPCGIGSWTRDGAGCGHPAACASQPLSCNARSEHSETP